MKTVFEYLGNHPDVVLSIAFFLISMLASFVFFALSSRKSVPVYIRMHEESLATVGEGANRLELLWKGEQIRNLRVATLVFLNRGKKPIMRSDISSDFPLEISAKQAVKILGVDLEQVSRKSLSIDLNISDDRGSVKVNLRNDEAFEKNDGFRVTLYFSADGETHWNMDGRIFGSTKPIKRMRTTSWISDSLGLITIVFLIAQGFGLRYLRGEFNIALTDDWSFLLISSPLLVFMISNLLNDIFRIPKWGKLRS
jgi:hypothetical protein